MRPKNADGGSGSRRGMKKMVCFQQDTLELERIVPIRCDPNVMSAHSEKGSPIGC
jgi:hypothetical protein